MGKRATQLDGLDENGDSLIMEIDDSKHFPQKYHIGHFKEGRTLGNRRD